jgi:hypothetical protein
LQGVIRANHARPAAEIAAEFGEDLARFHGPVNPADDVTFVIVKFRLAGVAARSSAPARSDAEPETPRE